MVEPESCSTADFVSAYAETGMRVLEVGCGDGALAAELSRRGLEVRGLDHSPDAVAAARARGVDAVAGDFLDFDGERFDRVLFTRSLHHIHPPERAVDRARRLLASGGRLLVEEFAVEAPDEPTAAWFYGAQSVLAAAGLSAEETSALPRDPLRRWAEEHDGHHPIATRAAMTAALGARFRLVDEWSCPYLYRYFEQALAGHPAGGAITATVLAWERDLIARGLLRAVGWRSVWACPKT